MQRFLSLLLLPLLCLTAFAQTSDTERPALYWSAAFNSVFDNREGDATYAQAQTFFFAQLAPEVGLTLSGGTHRIAAGAVWTQPVTDHFRDATLTPTLYYRFGRQGLTFAMGMFAKEMLYRPMPNYIWSDSANYVQRNVRGAMVSSVGRCGFFQAMIDWRGMQSDTRREAFNIVAMGEYQKGTSPWLAGGLAMMNHLARTSNAPEDERVVDNLLYNPYVGVDFRGGVGALDSLGVRVGILGALCRDRFVGSWACPVGLWLDAAASWRWLEIKNTLYAGSSPLYPYFRKFGALLDQGAPYYASSWYNHTTVAARLIRTRNVSLQASLDFNFAQSNFNFYQRLILRVTI